MAKFIGRRVNVGFGKESAHGVASAATFTVPKVDYSVDDKANMVQSGESFSSIVGSGGQAFVTGRFAEGDLETELNVNSFGLVLLATLGASRPESSPGVALRSEPRPVLAKAVRRWCAS